MNENIIEINNLSKSFGDVKAVQDLSFKVKKGQLFAFLGINGAGKSTTINIMCGQLFKDGGSVVVDGTNIDENVYAIKSEIGVVFQNSVLDSTLTVYENLKIRASLYGIKGEVFKARIAELAKLLDFESFLNRVVSKLSGGMRRRVDIARALIHSPKILVLDEPTTGLDPQTRKTLWKVIYDLRKTKNMTVFLTTHYMEEAADADYVVIIDNGKIVAEGSPHDLKNRYSGDYITIYDIAEEDVKKIGCEYEKLKKSYRISISNTADATKLITKHPSVFVDYEIVKGKMDDVFLNVTGKSLPGGEEDA